MTEGTMLLWTLMFANLLSLVVVAVSVGSGVVFKEKLKSLFTLNTSEGLIKQGLLWLAITVPVFNGAALGAWVWLGHDVNLSAEGFENFFKISILPIGIMSISLPLAGLVSRIHSTQQAAKQIAQAENQIAINRSKSNIDVFYAHRKGLTEYFAAIDDLNYFDTLTFTLKAHPVLHKRFFNGSPENGWPSVDEDSFAQVHRWIISGARYLKPVLEGESSKHLSDVQLYLNSCNSIYLAAEALTIKQIYKDLVQRGVVVKSTDDSHFVTLGTSTLDILAALRFVNEFFNNLCDYAGIERKDIPSDLDCMFTKTEKYHKEKKIQHLHAVDIKRLIESDSASYNEKHPNYLIYR